MSTPRFSGHRWLSLAAMAAGLLAASVAQAVPPTVDYGNNTLNIGSKTGRYQPQRPTVSPYLAIVPNAGNLSFINYFTITRPLFSQQQNNRAQGQELQQLEREVREEAQAIDSATGRTGIRATGHHAAFMTQRPYFRGAPMGAMTLNGNGSSRSQLGFRTNGASAIGSVSGR